MAFRGVLRGVAETNMAAHEGIPEWVNVEDGFNREEDGDWIEYVRKCVSEGAKYIPPLDGRQNTGTLMWVDRNGQPHRRDGPAIERMDYYTNVNCFEDFKSWYIHGRLVHRQSSIDPVSPGPVKIRGYQPLDDMDEETIKRVLGELTPREKVVAVSLAVLVLGTTVISSVMGGGW